MTAYYNENDPKAAEWLRMLILMGEIAEGDVDERSVEDVHPSDLKGYTQCHFFAGIGGWSYALRLAGWSDTRPVWTGSCPCQPFSAAGKGRGFADERHLWPAWLHLIRAIRPQQIFGEQVANALPWFDLVQADLEAEGYASGSVVLGAHSVGAPHIRQRLYWVADAESSDRRLLLQSREPRQAGIEFVGRGADGRMADSDSGFRGRRSSEPGAGPEALRTGQTEFRRCSVPSDMGNPDDERPQGRGIGGNGASERFAWASSLVYCTDGKYRPIEPGSFPLAHGVSGRVGLLRGYGNAIVPQVAAAFIQAYRSIVEVDA